MIPVDREQDLHILREAYTACLNGWGQLVVVSGGVACGKTELTRAFAKHAVDEGAVLLSATGSHAEQTLPFGLLRQLFHGVDPFRMIDLSSGSLNSAADSPTIDRDCAGVLDELCEELIQLATNRPVVITVDDIQFADKPSLRALLYLERRLRTSRVLLVFTEWTLPNAGYDLFRSEIVRPLQTVHLQLAPLSRAGIGRLLDEELGPKLAESLAAECHALSGGNPLLVRALIDDQRALRHHQAIPLTDGTLAVGQQFTRALIACLRRWGRTPYDVACGLGILWENRPSHSLLGELLDIEPGDVRRAVDVLETAGLATGGQLRHSAVRTAVLESVSPAEQAALHLKAAELLHGREARAADIAAQLMAADRLGATVRGRWAVDALRQAAQDHLLSHRFDAVPGWLDLAARGCVDGNERAEVLSLLLRVEWARRPSVASRHLAALEAARADGHLSQDDVLYLAKYLLWYGHLDELGEVLTAIADSASSDPAAPGSLGLTVEWLRFLCPPAGQGIARHMASPQMVSGTTWARAVDMLDRIRAGGPREAIIAAAEQVLSSSPLRDETIDLQLSALLALLYVDGDQRAEALCQLLLADAISQHAPVWRAMIGAIYALILSRRGDLAGAGRQAKTAQDLFTGQGWGVAIGIPLSVRVAVATRTGRYAEASAALHLPVPEAMFQTQFGLFYLYERGLFYLATNRVHSAMADFTRCGELMRQWNLDVQTLVPWRLGAARTHLAMGNPRAARALVEEQFAGSAPIGPRTRGMFLRVLAATSEPEDRVDLLRESVKLLAEGGDQFELSGALRELSLALQASGEASEARAVSARAAQLDRWYGDEPPHPEPLHPDALPLADPIGRHMSSALWKVGALSEAERRVAVLAALGLTNREISAKLYITVSTVEQHLTRVYRKLKVNRRTDLPADLDQYSTAELATASSASQRGSRRSRGR
ncbi:helix-turn-helix transcriptional regulator [Streptomyces sp. 8K308]|uniref:helix-turn-helix transcriptional regulator n=1 Tax=Streptomyces sp. 8K308 TaxID=2530388 RepID=UPI001048DE4B|nr:helix-turn-helix transcriptional regulator [Streptomyces sp. 8K308]TDC25353.1 helix-turn-helix transcriptional regulator [Streptomyces sp. 8K308]